MTIEYGKGEPWGGSFEVEPKDLSTMIVEPYPLYRGFEFSVTDSYIHPETGDIISCSPVYHRRYFNRKDVGNKALAACEKAIQEAQRPCAYGDCKRHSVVCSFPCNQPDCPKTTDNGRLKLRKGKWVEV